jgi:uncharacterized membrane protein YhaH (DUF805 family)
VGLNWFYEKITTIISVYMNFTQSVSTCFKKYLDFKGRASRSEFWYFFLFYILASFLGGFVVGFLVSPSSEFFYVLLIIIFVGLFIPALSVTVRRFHDFGVSGWMYCAFIPPLMISGYIQDTQPSLAGIIKLGTLVVFCVYVSQKPNKRKNKFGPVPKK